MHRNAASLAHCWRTGHHGLDDYIAAALLLYAWHVGRSEVSRSRPYLMAAWGYTLGIAYMSFFGQLKNAPGADPSGMTPTVVLAFKGVGLVLSVTCLALVWRSPETARRL